MPRTAAGVDVHRAWVRTEVQMQDPGQYTFYAPDRVYIPMQQHAGAPCTPVVKKGDRVRLGQPVGQSDAFVSAPVHASVSGTVAELAEVPQAGGQKALCVVIENDGQNTPFEAEAPTQTEDPAETRSRVRRAGIVGMGGAAFPTHVKLDPGDHQVDTLVLNGAECEPGIHADNALMLQHTREVLEGGLIALQAVGARRILIGIEADNAAALTAMSRAASAYAGTVAVHTLPALYPQGGEKQLIRTLTGRQVPEGRLPAAAGVVVLNVATARAIGHAVRHGTPLTRRICTVTGDVAAPQNVSFPLGTLAGALIEFCGGFLGRPSKLIAGGPMMGKTFDDLSVPLVKASNGLLVVGEGHDAAFTESPCIRCNRCVEACPMALVPWALDRYWRKNKFSACRSFHAQSCINCGCCTYVCPARRRLAEKITEAKNQLQRLEKEAQNA